MNSNVQPGHKIVFVALVIIAIILLISALFSPKANANPPEFPVALYSSVDENPDLSESSKIICNPPAETQRFQTSFKSDTSSYIEYKEGMILNVVKTTITRIDTILISDYPKELDNYGEAQNWNKGEKVERKEVVCMPLRGFLPVKYQEIHHVTSWLKGSYRAKEDFTMSSEKSFGPGIAFLSVFLIFGIFVLLVFNTSKGKELIKNNPWFLYLHIILSLALMGTSYTVLSSHMNISLEYFGIIALILFGFFLLVLFQLKSEKNETLFVEKEEIYPSLKGIFWIIQSLLVVLMIYFIFKKHPADLSDTFVLFPSQIIAMDGFIAVCLILPVVPAIIRKIKEKKLPKGIVQSVSKF